MAFAKSRTDATPSQGLSISGRESEFGVRAFPIGRTAELVLSILVAAVLLGQGISRPFEHDQESLSAQWIRDVVAHDHWLIAWDDYGCIARKPPLFYWASAVVADARGGEVNEVRARVVSLAAATLTAVVLLFWSSAHLGAAAGWLGFFFLLGSYAFASRATIDLTDMLLTFLVFAAYCLSFPLIEGAKSARRAVAAGIILGLGILTKGPLALVLFASAAFIYRLLTGSNPFSLLKYRWPWLVALISLAVAACWYGPALTAKGGDYFQVIAAENFGHFVSSRHGGTGEDAQPFYYITAKLIGGAFPLALLIPAALTALFAGGRVARPQRKALLFHLSMVFAVLILFTIASAKRADYILPAMPSLAVVLLGPFIIGAGDGGFSRWTRALRDIAAGLTAVTIALAAVALPIALRIDGFSAHLLNFDSGTSDAKQALVFLKGMQELSAPYIAFAGKVLIGAVLTLAGIFRRRALAVGVGLAAVSLAGVVLLDGTIRPELARRRTLKWFAAEIHRQIGDAPLYLVWQRDNDLAYYYGRGLPLLNDSPAPQAAPDLPAYLFASSNDLERLGPPYRGHLKVVLRSHIVGGAGPPYLYQLIPGPGGFHLAYEPGPMKPDCGT